MEIFHTAHLRVHPAAIEPFKARLLRHARTSVAAEPGCRCFDVHQETSDPSLFLLIERYADEAAFDAHRSSRHFVAFREDVKDWVVERTWWYWDALETGPTPSGEELR